VEHALAVTIDHPMAAVAGLAAMVCYASWPLCGSRSSILATYIGNNLAFMLHYALLSQWTAVAMNSILALQTVVAMRLAKKPRLRWVAHARARIRERGHLAGRAVATGGCSRNTVHAGPHAAQRHILAPLVAGVGANLAGT
jgi:hypothetical protein